MKKFKVKCDVIRWHFHRHVGRDRGRDVGDAESAPTSDTRFAIRGEQISVPGKPSVAARAEAGAFAVRVGEGIAQ
jgi:hypothetical protein